MARTQHQCYKTAKENIKADEVVVHVDFSENYDNKQQHATQSAYFGYQQFSIYTVAIYHKEGIEKMAIITPDKDHSHVVIYHLNNFIIDKLKEKIPSLRKVIFWSDGCASQFKSRYVFLDLTKLHRDIDIEWNYFESNHGKEAVDGIGGCVKQKVFKHVKAFKVVLSTAEEFSKYANEVVAGIEVLYHDTSEIEYSSNKELAVAVNGTRKVRMIQRNVNGDTVKLFFFTNSGTQDSFFIQSYASSQEICTSESNQSPTNDQEVDLVISQPAGKINIKTGCWYAVYFKAYDYWFVGLAIEIISENMVKIDFLQQFGQNVNRFGTKEEIEEVQISDVFMGVSHEPVPISSTRTNQLKLSDSDYERIAELFSGGLY